MSLDGRSAIVTGAGAGVGRGIAMALAAAGAHVIVASRSDTGVAAEITTRGHRATWTRCDVTAPDDLVAAVDEALTSCGRLDAFVHNATSNMSSQPHRLADVQRQQFDDHYSVSVGGARNCAAAAFDALKVHGGTFLVFTSPAGIEGSATLPLYATMKGALRGFAKSLARKWAPHAITVNVVSPLAYSPAMAAAIEADPAMEQRLSRRVPLGRIGDPERDIGSAIAFLVGPSARYITGQTLGVDGGHFMNL